MKGDSFLQYIWFEVGSGFRIRFWHDCWRGDQPLKMMFPILFEVAMDRDAFVESLLESQEDGGEGVGVWDSRETVMIGRFMGWLHFSIFGIPIFLLGRGRSDEMEAKE